MEFELKEKSVGIITMDLDGDRMTRKTLRRT